jgi:GNAT superfamily N-acetyltransferase
MSRLTLKSTKEVHSCVYDGKTTYIEYKISHGETEIGHCYATVYHCISEAELHSFKIYEDFRRVGFGRRSFELILKHILKTVSKDTVIKLTVWETNVPAIKIYKSLGFTNDPKDSDILTMKYKQPKNQTLCKTN